MAFLGRDFLVLWQGQLVSQLGSQAFLVASTYATLEATGSSALVAAVMMASTVPLAVLSPIGGAFADRHSRRAILVATDLLRASTVGGLALFMFWAPEAKSGHVAAIIVVAGIGGVMEALFSPAIQALIPELVPRDRLAAANSVSQMSRQTATLVGQALGGVFYVIWGGAVLLSIDAISFAYGGVATWYLPRDRVQRARPLGIRLALVEYAASTRQGWMYVWRRRGMTAVLVTFAGVNFLFMPVFVLLPFYTREVLGGGADSYGFLLGAAGAGALFGSLAAAVVVARGRRPGTLVRLCVLGIACGVLMLAASSTRVASLAALAAVGALSSLVNVIVITAFQSAVPPDVRGRVMALVIAVSTAAVPLGMGLGGVMGTLWSDALRLVFAGCAVAMALLIAATWRTRGFSEVLEPSPDPSR